MSEQNDRWLVRSNQRSRNSGAFTIFGPFAREDLLAKIRAGEWRGDDEACRANGYWFSLHESNSMREQLGVDAVPLLRAVDEEPTQPDISEVTGKIARVESSMNDSAAGGGGSAPTVALSKAPSYRVEPRQLWSILLLVGMALGVLGVVWLLRSLHASSD